MAATSSSWKPALALALVLAAPTAAADATLEHYRVLPMEHDDQGRSDEPDFAATGVLGVPLQNCVASRDPFATPGLGRACIPDGALLAAGPIAPGCTDDAGRQPSGLCALWSSGVPSPGGDASPALLAPGLVGIPGVSGSAAPGGLTPTKGDLVRFLDLHFAASLPVASMVEVNRKLADLGLRDVLASLTPEASGSFIPSAAALWAWYGVWQDKNGNGVVDHLTSGAEAWATNEFRWVGNCLGPASPEVCLAEQKLVFPVWVWPGNHHQTCGFLIGCYAPADHPGRQVVCFAAFHVVRDPRLFNCLPAGGFDAEERDADPLLGPGEDRVRADGEMGDGTGEADPDKRLWDFGLPPGYYYDQSLLTTTVVVGGPTLRGADPGHAAGFDLAALQFVDVDVYPAWAPLLGDVLNQSVKPGARGPWVLARDTYPPLATATDGAVHGAAHDAATHPVAGLDAALRDPGWSREPNHPDDAYPGAVFRAHGPGGDLPEGEQAHRGWRNDHAGSAAAWHAWADLHAQRLHATYGAFRLGDLCLEPCAIGGGFWDSWSVLPGQGAAFPRAPGDHGRSLEPGAYQFRGFVGAWRDQAHAMVETMLDLAASLEAREPVVGTERYVLEPDGWVGNIVNTTAAYRYRGYGEASCFLEGREQVRAWAVCNPYLDADVAGADGEAGLDQSFGLDLSDPQDVRDAAEFQVLTTPPAQATVVLRPEGGTWTFPVFAWRDFYHWRVGDVAAVQDLTGTSQPVTLAVLPQLEPALRSRVITQDLLVLPAGNLGQGVTSTFAFHVRLDVPGRGIHVDEPVVDVDAYRPWGP